MSVSKYIVVLSLLTITCGCSPGVRVKKNPTDRDAGIRYYRPKPYLLITPAGSTTSTETTKTDGTKEKKSSSTPSDKYVNLKMEYLPDFSEEYSIKVRPGFGTANVDITLENGWNLTAINQQLDSQTDENLGALAEVISAAGSVIPTSAGATDATPGDKEWVVKATNVPIGYYESVVGYDQYCGKKRLYGWRYVGFAPYNYCPTDICGSQQANCNDGSGAVYGLAFDKGVMTFRQLGLLSYESGSDLALVPIGQVTSKDNNDATTRLSDVTEKIKSSIIENNNNLENNTFSVDPVLQGDQVTRVYFDMGNENDTALLVDDTNGQVLPSVKETIKQAVTSANLELSDTAQIHILPCKTL